MKEGREDRLRHVVANDEVSVRCAKVAGVSLHSLPERGISVGELSVARERRGQDHGAPIERVLTGNLELLLSLREVCSSFRLGEVRLFGMMPKIRLLSTGAGSGAGCGAV